MARIRGGSLRAALRELEPMEFLSDEEEELSEIHAELALLDGHIVGLAQSLLNGSRVPPSAFRVDADLRKRLEAAGAFGGHIGKTAATYLLYLSKLEQLITEARSAAKLNSTSKRVPFEDCGRNAYRKLGGATGLVCRHVGH